MTYFALSHYHADHTANANEFAGATWIVQKRAKVAALMKETGAAMWIAHDIITHAKLPKAPKFVE